MHSKFDTEIAWSQMYQEENNPNPYYWWIRFNNGSTSGPHEVKPHFCNQFM